MPYSRLMTLIQYSATNFYALPSPNYAQMTQYDQLTRHNLAQVQSTPL